MQPRRTPKKFSDVVLPADHEPTKMMEPGKRSFDSPTSAVTPQRAPSCVGVRRFPRCGAIISMP
jgi:hypothetical protein